jgi:hypothetical protein
VSDDKDSEVYDARRALVDGIASASLSLVAIVSMTIVFSVRHDFPVAAYIGVIGPLGVRATGLLLYLRGGKR